MPVYGYDAGQPFGDPSKFTRGTGEDEIDRFNQWMRVQPWYQAYMDSQGLTNRGPDKGFSDKQQKDIENLLRQQGITLPSAFHVDSGGNINQKNRTARNIGIAAAIAGGAFAAPALIGALGAGAGAAGAGAAGATGAGAAGSTGLLAATTPAWSTGVLAPTVTSALGAGGAAGLGAAGAGAAGLGAAGTAGGGSAVAGGGSILSSLLKNPETYSTAASLLGSAGKGAAAERGQANQYQLSQDRAKAELFRAQQDAAFRAAEMGISAPQARTKQAILGSLLQGLQPVSVQVSERLQPSMVKYSGGLNASLLNDLARQSGAELQRQANQALLTGSDQPKMPEVPQLSQYQQAGKGESIASGASTALSAAGLIASLLKNRNQAGG